MPLCVAAHAWLQGELSKPGPAPPEGRARILLEVPGPFPQPSVTICILPLWRQRAALGQLVRGLRLLCQVVSLQVVWGPPTLVEAV